MFRCCRFFGICVKLNHSPGGELLTKSLLEILRVSKISTVKPSERTKFMFIHAFNTERLNIFKNLGHIETGD